MIFKTTKSPSIWYGLHLYSFLTFYLIAFGFPKLLSSEKTFSTGHAWHFNPSFGLKDPIEPSGLRFIETKNALMLLILLKISSSLFHLWGWGYVKLTGGGWSKVELGLSFLGVHYRNIALTYQKKKKKKNYRNITLLSHWIWKNLNVSDTPWKENGFRKN